jgi:small-conductance mechanosensitive channel
MDLDSVKGFIDQLTVTLFEWIVSPPFYSQVGLALLAALVAYSIFLLLRRWLNLLMQAPETGTLYRLRQGLFRSRDLILPLLLILVFSLTVDLSNYLVEQSTVIRFCLSLATVFMLYSLISRFVRHRLTRKAIMWIAIPIALLESFDLLGYVTGYLEEIRLEVGNISISAYGVVRVLIFGSVLFWIGRLSNVVGQSLIRRQEDLDVGTREVFAKVFQVVLFIIVFILLLQVMGINLTALAVFGGALGVGLGFGLQAIASNFISGIILLLDRSLTVGDYVELDDGRCGTIRELNMRSTTLETYDGKDVMVPNEQFITTSFTNWTHKNTKQRYSLEFQVAYDTDMRTMLALVRDTINSHPQVLSGADLPIEERADAEIKGFGDFGVDILVEFWMEGIDDGPNRVGADLLLMIFEALRSHGIEIPFPQREVRILGSHGDTLPETPSL